MPARYCVKAVLLQGAFVKEISTFNDIRLTEDLSMAKYWPATTPNESIQKELSNITFWIEGKGAILTANDIVVCTYNMTLQLASMQ